MRSYEAYQDIVESEQAEEMMARAEHEDLFGNPVAPLPDDDRPYMRMTTREALDKRMQWS